MTASGKDVDRQAPLRLAERLAQQAETAGDFRLRRRLLAQSCELIDAALREHQPPAPR